MKAYRIRENNVLGIWLTKEHATDAVMADKPEDALEMLMANLPTENDYCECCGERWVDYNLQVLRCGSWEYV